jgi:hypothetical protein
VTSTTRPVDWVGLSSIFQLQDRHFANYVSQDSVLSDNEAAFSQHQHFANKAERYATSLLF